MTCAQNWPSACWGTDSVLPNSLLLVQCVCKKLCGAKIIRNPGTSPILFTMLGGAARADAGAPAIFLKSIVG